MIATSGLTSHVMAMVAAVSHGAPSVPSKSASSRPKDADWVSVLSPLSQSASSRSSTQSSGSDQQIKDQEIKRSLISTNLFETSGGLGFYKFKVEAFASWISSNPVFNGEGQSQVKSYVRDVCDCSLHISEWVKVIQTVTLHIQRLQVNETSGDFDDESNLKQILTELVSTSYRIQKQRDPHQRLLNHWFRQLYNWCRLTQETDPLIFFVLYADVSSPTTPKLDFSKHYAQIKFLQHILERNRFNVDLGVGAP